MAALAPAAEHGHRKAAPEAHRPTPQRPQAGQKSQQQQQQLDPYPRRPAPAAPASLHAQQQQQQVCHWPAHVYLHAHTWPIGKRVQQQWLSAATAAAADGSSVHAAEMVRDVSLTRTTWHGCSMMAEAWESLLAEEASQRTGCSCWPSTPIRAALASAWAARCQPAAMLHSWHTCCRSACLLAPSRTCLLFHLEVPFWLRHSIWAWCPDMHSTPMRVSTHACVPAAQARHAQHYAMG